MRTGSTPDEALGDFYTADRVAVAMPDATRPMDPLPPLRALAARLPAMRVVIGLGLHRPMNSAEMDRLGPFAVVQSDPDDTVPTVVVDGIQGAVHRTVAEADRAISVGVGELHQYAGVSGGHKGVAVGCGGRGTIAALHHRDRVTAAGVEVGRVLANPFRAAVDGLGRAARCTHALLWVPAVGLWLFGDPTEVVVEAATRIDPWEPIDHPAPGAVLRVPSAKASSLYQASRAATYLGLSPSPPVLDGGTLRLEAACPEGLGAETGFVAALSSCPPPWTALLTGPPPTGAGAQRAVMIALLARRYRLEIAGCTQPAALRAVGFAATRAPPEVPEGWLDVEAPFVRLPQLRH